MASINFARIVERSEDSGPDPFHVPQMKVFVSDDKKKPAIRRLVDEVVFPHGDPRGIEMLHTTAPSLRLDFHKERIVLVGQLPENRPARVDDVLYIRNDLFRASSKYPVC